MREPRRHPQGGQASGARGELSGFSLDACTPPHPRLGLPPPGHATRPAEGAAQPLQGTNRWVARRFREEAATGRPQATNAAARS